nr:peptidoglycan-binding protein [Cylindrospermum stagnale]
MRLWPSSILIFTCFSGLGFYPSYASTVTPNLAPKILELAQASSTVPPSSTDLSSGTQGPDVQVLQTQLKELGYYKGVVDGDYGESTGIAVAKFQQAKGLIADGIAGKTTRESLQAAITAKNSVVSTPKPTPKPITQPKQTRRGFIWWSLLGLGLLGTIGAILYLIRRFTRSPQIQESQTLERETLNAASQDPVTPPLPKSEDNAEEVTFIQTTARPTKLLPPEKTSRLAKLNIVDELIKDLHSPDPIKRRKAIWDLGQQGDSRAINPLVDLMIDADSQQHGLILAALAEIGIRTLKPMNRALAVSMQDESPDVRQNAIRDLARVYDMMGQMSQILRHAAEDTDPEVQATARYALNHLNRVRGLPKQEDQPEDTPQEPQP